MLHLAPDGVGLFLAAPRFSFNARVREFTRQCLADLFHQTFVAGADIDQLFGDGLIGFRVQPAEGVIFQFFAQRLHAHEAGQRRVDIECFFRVPFAALGLHVLKRAHVVQAVGELDQKHANVAGDSDQQFAEIFGLFGPLRDEVQALDLGQTVDEAADFVAEHVIDLGPRRIRVLNYVMQQRRGDGGVVELQVGQDGGDFEGMGEIRRARRPLLRTVRLHGVDVGAIEQRLVRLLVILENPFDEFVLPHHCPPHSLCNRP